MRASRRHVGAQLQQQPHAAVPVLSFDVSRVRLQIQRGLGGAGGVRSRAGARGGAREAKSAAAQVEGTISLQSCGARVEVKDLRQQKEHLSIDRFLNRRWTKPSRGEIL